MADTLVETDPDETGARAQAAAFAGLASNPSLSVSDRLDCALTAIKWHEQYLLELQQAVEDELDRSDDRSFGYLVGLRWALDLVSGEVRMRCGTQQSES